MLFFVAAVSIALAVAASTSIYIVAAAEQADLSRPDLTVAELINFRDSNNKQFAEQDGSYRLGRTAVESGDTGLAMAAFQRSAGESRLLRERALRHLAQIARSSGNLLLERIYLAELVAFSNDEQLAKPILARLARSHFESGNYADTIRLLSTASPGVDGAASRENRDLLAAAHLRSNDAARARSIYAELLDTSPVPAQPDDVALDAAKELDKIDGAGPSGVPQLTAADHVKRAAVYQFNREFETARAHYTAAIAAEADPLVTSDAMFQVGRGYVQTTNYVEALHWFERAIERFPDSPAAKDSLLNAASAYSRVGKSKEAISRYELFAEKYPDEPRLDRAHLNIVDILRDQGQDTEAIEKCRAIRTAFKGKPAEAVALFAEARINLAREEWAKAIEALGQLLELHDLGGAAVPGGTSKDEVHFLLAYAHERSGNAAWAIERYLSIPDGPGDYYGWLAADRLAMLSLTPGAADAVRKELERAEQSLAGPHGEARTRAARAVLALSDRKELIDHAVSAIKSPETSNAGPPIGSISKAGPLDLPLPKRLISLGLFDEAAAVLEPELRSLSATDSVRLLDVVNKGDRGDLVMAISEPLWDHASRLVPARAVPAERLLHLYPAPYARHLVAQGKLQGVDPRLMLAIIRQESRFRTNAKSNSAARGLMQFIATTATRIGRKTGRENITADELYSPVVSIELGAQYLNDLFVLFPEQPEAVAASYNGGEDNMKRWLNRARSNEPGRYVPEIVYAQSKDYVYKVISAYRVYQYLYDQELRPVGPAK